MMDLLTALMIVTGLTATSIEAADRTVGADEVFVARFSEAEDINYDAWPDGWRRRTGRGFPRYLKIEIANAPEPTQQNRALRIRMDGGAAEVYSPPIQCSPLFSYSLRLKIRAVGLKYDRISAAVLFQDQHGKPLEEVATEPITDTKKQWVDVHIGPITPRHQATTTAVIVLRVHPTSHADLRGEAWFDDIWFGRLPRMILEAESPAGIYLEGESVQVRCTVSGSGIDFPNIQFQLLDASGKLMAEEVKPLEGGVISHAPSATAMNMSARQEFAGTATWSPPLTGRGFFRIRARMAGSDHQALERTLSFAVLEENENDPAGEFGWSLPQGEEPFSVKELANLIPQLGVRWVKFPAWYSTEDTDRGERLAWFAERLASRNIEMVGVLDQPPADVLARLPENGRVSTAALFLDSDIWQPSIDPVMVRLSLKVKWWQIGGDDDYSFIAFPGLPRKIAEIKSRFDQFGQKTKVGLNWKWLVEPPPSETASWSFLSLAEDPPFTSNELRAYLDPEASPSFETWVTLKPLSARDYSPSVRIQDLVERMVVAKVRGADAIITTDPFDPETGLFTPEGQPTELLLPWVTVARQLGGAKYLGQLHLPSRSQNYVFERDGEAVLVAWNVKPTEEVLYLGENPRIHALDGTVTDAPVRMEAGIKRHVLQVGNKVVIVSGLDLAVTKWRLRFKFDRDHLDSVFGREQIARFQFANTFPGGVSGRVELVLPKQWGTEFRGSRFKLLSNDVHDEAIRIILGVDATSGAQLVRIDFDITARRRYRFSVYRTMEVGLGDVTMEVATRLDAEGNLVVDQHLDNQSDRPMSFNCMLFAPQRRRMRQSVFQLQRGRTTVTFVLPRGEELVGKKIWVRAEEIRGNRLLNQELTVKP